MDLPKDPWVILGTAVSGIMMGIMWLRVRLSKDATTIAGDRAEIDMIKRLGDENRDLRASLTEVSAERNLLYREVGEMAGSIRALEASQKLMELHIMQLKSEITGLHNALERTGNEKHP